MHNKIIVAIPGEDFTLKRLQVINGSKIFLKSENPAYPAIEVSSRTDFEIWGCVIHTCCEEGEVAEDSNDSTSNHVSGYTREDTS